MLTQVFPYGAGHEGARAHAAANRGGVELRYAIPIKWVKRIQTELDSYLWRNRQKNSEIHFALLHMQMNKK
jgi:hypothetical protein